MSQLFNVYYSIAAPDERLPSVRVRYLFSICSVYVQYLFSHSLDIHWTYTGQILDMKRRWRRGGREALGRVLKTRADAFLW